MPPNLVFSSDNYSLTDNGMSADPPSPSPSSSSLDGLGDFFEGLATANSPSSRNETTPKALDVPIPTYPPKMNSTTTNPTRPAIPDSVLFPEAGKLDSIMAALGHGPYDQDTLLITRSVSSARHLMEMARRLAGDTETLYQANLAINQSSELFSRSDYAAEQVGRKRKRETESVADDHEFYDFRPLQTPSSSEMHVDTDSEFPSPGSEDGDLDDNRPDKFKIYLDHMDTTKAQDPEQVAAWEKLNNAVLVRIYGATPNTGDDAILACRTIEAAIRTALPLRSEDIVVSPPKRDDTVRNPSIRPAYFLVVLGCPEDFWALRALPYINNEHGSILIIGHPPVPPNSFVATATALTLSGSDKHIAILKRAIADALATTSAGDRYRAFWKRHNVSSLSGIHFAVCVPAVLSHLSIVPSTVGLKLGQSKTVFAIHIPPFTDNHVLHYEWRRLFAEVRVDTVLYGSSRLDLRPYFCEGCHGVDHPKGLCPFLAIPDWKVDSGFSSGSSGAIPVRGPKARA